MAVIRHAERNGARRPWLVQLLARTATKHAAIALANKTARIVWALMISGESYRDDPRCPVSFGCRGRILSLAARGR